MTAAAYLAFAGLSAVACVSLSPTPSPNPTPVTHDILVSVAVRGRTYGSNPALRTLSAVRCEARNAYRDVGIGMEAVIRDSSDNVIGSARFSTAGEITESDSSGPTECTFRVLVVNVPDIASYAVEAGDKGRILVARAELEANDWTASVTLGESDN